ncbi:MAG: protease [Alphaproteobacteria bacterium BRH_c36]|nr:MAG: protease [Alphaproteobacteria bacterium BRH_c36]
MKLTLGPVLFNWPTLAWSDFYARIADEAPVDRVVVGEVVCSKRSPFRLEAAGAVVERLERGGKEVVIAALALPTLKREIVEIDAAAEGLHLIEIGDVTALAAVAGQPHVIGPMFNVYNEATLSELAALGAMTVCLPPELPMSSVAVLGKAQASPELEVFAFGRAPLAVAARCYHARAHGLMKDACRYVCENDPDGLEVETLDGQPFLAVNGVQTLASGVTVLSGEVADLRAANVARLRLSPQTGDMVAVAQSFRDLIDGRIDAAEQLARISALQLPGEIVNGYLHARPGAVHVSAAS